jgi:hypothetical protein
MTEIAKRVEGAKRMAVRQRNYRRARDRALSRLANAYPETYKELLEQEKVADVELGKKWVDIDGSSSLLVVARTGNREEGIVIESADYIREREGDSK